MDDFATGPVIVLAPEEGEPFWQPLSSIGYIINKLTPYNTPYDSFSMGIQILEPGAHVRRHGHERQHEVLFCYEGDGWVEIGDQRYDMRPET
jgi:mannose-6-phosphate isomerase-like protein (cupin superfamily)